jgi:hypothetical protein
MDNSDTDVAHQVLSENEIVNACIKNTEIELDSSEEEDDGTDQLTGAQHMVKQLQCWSLMTLRNKVKHLLLNY